MKISEQWLREWTNPAVSTDELVAQLTMAGLEVDAVTPVAGVFSGVVVGHVLDVQPHPDADKLRVCRVDAGSGEPLQIVCGAPNVHTGMRAPVATIGAVLPGDFKIRKSKLRGVESFGMLCSARELGLSEDHGGLMPLPAEAVPGTDLRACLGLDDRVIEVDLTPNRGDCLSVAGVAREVAVLNGSALTPVVCTPVPAASEEVFPVRIEAGADCPRYAGRVIRGVDPRAATPLWMTERLRRAGLRSLGPLVDVTNYVLLELGQPMHAYDLDRLRQGIHVRHANEGESLELLDGKSVELASDVLVIADGEGPVGLAGIMGGARTAVQPGSTRVFLEVAYFAPSAIAGRARRFGLTTDASQRFERGVDPEGGRRAIERATALLLEIAGGRAGPVQVTEEPALLPSRSPVLLRR
ncbi:MAG TPA: phenylalanine--tRNA ligase subunit beta, partial [Plasticicumulans sp.]|nr:phenylalanine--tRNA ligase subunit beta [Plasticicumulans sp.]